MAEPVNPYASPQAELTAAPFAQEEQLAIPGLKTTGIGLSMVYYGIVIMLLALFTFFMIGFVFQTVGQPLTGGPGRYSIYYVIVIYAIMIIDGAAVILGGMLNFFGQIVCLFIPSRSSAKGYIIATVILHLFSVAFFVCLIVQLLILHAGLSIGIIISMNLCEIASTLLFVLFMRKLSEYIGRIDLMNKARNILVLVFLLLGIAIVMYIGASILENDYFGFLTFILVPGALIGFVMYANLINVLRKVLLGKQPRAQKSFLLSA